jgi:hypothetical protein
LSCLESIGASADVPPRETEVIMPDAIFLVVGVAFLVGCIAYVAFCEHA